MGIAALSARVAGVPSIGYGGTTVPGARIVNPKIEAILTLRGLSERFARGDLSFEELRTGWDWHLCDVFDEDDERASVAAFADDVRAECMFYLTWARAGGRTEFRNAAWVYGSLEPNGWIDKEAYRKAFREAFARLRLSSAIVDPGTAKDGPA
jgi:hypothetical protein